MTETRGKYITSTLAQSQIAYARQKAIEAGRYSETPVVPDEFGALADWEIRMVRKVRELRASGKCVRLFFEWQGPALLITKLVPEGRISVE